MFTAIFADVLAPYDPLFTRPEIRLAPPSWQHPFGTDDIGRDVLSRIIYGTRLSLWVGLLAVGIGTVAGTLIGLICGYWEGWLDLGLQRVMDALMTIPGLILALAIVSVLTPNTTNAMLAIAIVIIPGNSRIVRGAVLSAKQNPYVEAARALGCGHLRIIASHILPNVTAPILIIASIWLGNAIFPGLQSLWRCVARCVGSQTPRSELKVHCRPVSISSSLASRILQKALDIWLH